MNKQPLAVKKLPRTGYPDIEIVYTDHVTYLEMKTSAVKVNLDLDIFTILIQGKLTQLQDIFFWIFQFHKKAKGIGR